jgi:hypothetical protein
MLDKANLGSNTLSTHVLVSSTIRRLDKLGLLERVRATGAPPIRTFLVEFGGQAFPRAVQGPPNECNGSQKLARPQQSCTEAYDVNLAGQSIAPWCSAGAA